MPWSHQNLGFENPFDPIMFPQKGTGLFLVLQRQGADTFDGRKSCTS